MASSTSPSIPSARRPKRNSVVRAKALAPSASSPSISNLTSWKLEDAKARFSELVRDAGKTPQMVTVRGKETAVILAAEDYRRLVSQPEQQSLTDFLATLDFSGIDLEREPDYGRDIDFLEHSKGSQ
jgi:prevent-host-death family protein